MATPLQKKLVSAAFADILATVRIITTLGNTQPALCESLDTLKTKFTFNINLKSDPIPGGTMRDQIVLCLIEAVDPWPGYIAGTDANTTLVDLAGKLRHVASNQFNFFLWEFNIAPALRRWADAFDGADGERRPIQESAANDMDPDQFRATDRL